MALLLLEIFRGSLAILGIVIVWAFIAIIIYSIISTLKDKKHLNDMMNK